MLLHHFNYWLENFCSCWLYNCCANGFGIEFTLRFGNIVGFLILRRRARTLLWCYSDFLCLNGLKLSFLICRFRRKLRLNMWRLPKRVQINMLLVAIFWNQHVQELKASLSVVQTGARKDHSLDGCTLGIQLLPESWMSLQKGSLPRFQLHLIV